MELTACQILTSCHKLYKYKTKNEEAVAQKLQLIDWCGNNIIHCIVSRKVSVISLNIRHSVISAGAIHLFVHSKLIADSWMRTLNYFVIMSDTFVTNHQKLLHTVHGSG